MDVREWYANINFISHTQNKYTLLFCYYSLTVTKEFVIYD